MAAKQLCKLAASTFFGRWKLKLCYLVGVSLLLGFAAYYYETSRRLETERKALDVLSRFGTIYRYSDDRLVLLTFDREEMRSVHQLPKQLLTPLERVRRAGDEQVKQLKELKTLESLSLGDTDISDKGLADLRCLTNLKHLSLSGTKVSLEGLQYLASF